jgi:hypothetical protein
MVVDSHLALCVRDKRLRKVKRAYLLVDPGFTAGFTTLQQHHGSHGQQHACSARSRVRTYVYY